MPTIKIKGMSCAHCVASVTKALSDIDGVEQVHVNLEEGLAEFVQTREIPAETLSQAIEKIGFEVK